MALLRVAGLGDEPLAAAARFYAGSLGEIGRALAPADAPAPEHLVIAFEPADYRHRGWRLAAVQQLARNHAPIRVNAVAGDDEQALAAALTYLDAAPGVTGQYLPLAGEGAEALLSPSR